MNHFRPDSLKSGDSLFYENEIENLKQEFENERINRDNALSRNIDLENSIVKIQEQLGKNDYDWENDVELKNVVNKNIALNEEIQDLKTQIPELKEKLKNAKVCGKDCRMKHDNLNINFDLLTEVELLKTTKRLERLRTDIKSELISKEWHLDNESKVYQRLLDQKIHLQNQLYRTNTLPPIKNNSIKNWQNNGIPKSYRTLDINKGPIRQTVLCEKLPAMNKLIKA